MKRGKIFLHTVFDAPRISGSGSPQVLAKNLSKNIHIITVLEDPDLFWHYADPTKKGNPSPEVFPIQT